MIPFAIAVISDFTDPLLFRKGSYEQTENFMSISAALRLAVCVYRTALLIPKFEAKMFIRHSENNLIQYIA